MPTIEERFASKFTENAVGCWIWTASRNPKGYGWFWHGDRMQLAHRFAYEHFIEPIPDELVIDHLCRQPSCVRPSHLEVVTVAENTRRGSSFTVVNAAKRSCPQGHPYDEENTYLRSDGARVCRTCRSELDRRRGPRRITA